MKIVADEGVPRSVVVALREDGQDVEYVAEFAPGVDDIAVLSHAVESGALLLTQDKDFGELVVRQGVEHRGVMLIRLSGLSSRARAQRVRDAVRLHRETLLDAFSVLRERGLRVRRIVEDLDPD